MLNIKRCVCGKNSFYKSKIRGLYLKAGYNAIVRQKNLSRKKTSHLNILISFSLIWYVLILQHFICCPRIEYVKLEVLWEGQKICEITTLDLSFAVNVKSTVEISQNFGLLRIYIKIARRFFCFLTNDRKFVTALGLSDLYIPCRTLSDTR